MRRPVAKFGFVHRRLWARDATYRAAFLAGPPPLIGIAVATAVWLGMHASIGPAKQAMGASLPWAHYTPPVAVTASSSPIAVAPDYRLPAIGADALPAGLTTGWKGQVSPITVSSVDVDVLGTPLAEFWLDQAYIDLDRIIAAGPQGGLFVGVESAFLAIRTAGVYGLSIRANRFSDQSADCLERLVFAKRRLVSNISLNLSGFRWRIFAPIRFDLQPGLYRIHVVFGCWIGRHSVGPGRLAVLIRHPGERALKPARPEEILRPISSN